ncbi:G-protein coupled receptor GRL101-like, partial [Glandiceps talaboti]
TSGTSHQGLVCAQETEFECQPGVCVAISSKCNDIPDCENGQDESILECGCPHYQFQCNETTCIDMVRRCDMTDDCLDGSDEENCDKFHCMQTHVKCAESQKCIPHYKTCDYVDDCGDNSDELFGNCHHRKCYPFGEYQCHNKQCVSSYAVCDGVRDCGDGSDEIECTDDHFVTCSDGRKSHRHQWCDGLVHCESDHADEVMCECNEGDFKCDNGECIRQAYRCDLHCDCAGSCEDEKYCGEDVCTLSNHLWCIDFERCLHKDYFCDGVVDCMDEMDEYGCYDDINCTEHMMNTPSMPHTNCAIHGGPNRCIPNHAICDHRIDCAGGSDEANDECDHGLCEEDEFQCNTGLPQCIPLYQRCDTRNDCADKSDERKCEQHECSDDTLRCNRSGQCVKKDLWCDFASDCSDNSDEENCDHIIRNCTEKEFQCQNGQCVPLERRCFLDEGDIHLGCKDGTHLINCNHAECSEEDLKCRNGHCVSQSLVCNGYLECPVFTDEEGCVHVCSPPNDNCTCMDIEMNCEKTGMRALSDYIEPGYVKLKLGHNRFGNNPTLGNETFVSLSRLIYLGLEDNNITDLKSHTFSMLWRLMTLDLEDNGIRVLHTDSFDGLVSLRSLHLFGNGMEEIEPYAFTGLSSLTTLDLHGQKLRWLHMNAFTGMYNLHSLNLSHNQLQYVNNGVFNGLYKLLVLDLSHNMLVEVESKVFFGLIKLDEIFTDEYRFCCLAKFVPHCYPTPDEFSSCEDLMSNLVLRTFIWVLGGTSLIGNLVVVMWRLRDRRDNKVHSFLITNLAVGDMCMGMYLMIIAAADAYYRGHYFIYEKLWRDSTFCRIAGFLSTFSSELSVFTLTVITVDRLICIVFPFRFKRLEFQGACRLMAVLWTTVFLISGLPLFGINYFGNYYGRSGVCLAFHITPDKPDGWQYSVFIFFLVNFINFLIILLSYVAMFIVASKTQQAVRNRDLKTESAMAKRITLIVMTDFFCWVPIILLGVASLGGAVIPPQVYAWVAVFVLPLNSALNPILYTLSTPTFLKRTRKMADSIGESFRSRWRADGRTSSFTISESQARSSFSYTGIDRTDRCASVGSSNSTVAIRLRSLSSSHNGGVDLIGYHEKHTGSDPSTRERCDSGKSVTFATDSIDWARKVLQRTPKDIKIVDKVAESKFKVEFKPEDQTIGPMMVGFLVCFSDAKEKHFTRLREIFKKISGKETAHDNVLKMLWSGAKSDIFQWYTMTDPLSDDVRWCLCFEYVDGVTLKSFAQDRIDTRELTHIIIHIAKALDHLRKHKIVYNNLSTSTVLIHSLEQESTRKVKPILFDFSKAVDLSLDILCDVDNMNDVMGIAHMLNDLCSSVLVTTDTEDNDYEKTPLFPDRNTSQRNGLRADEVLRMCISECVNEPPSAYDILSQLNTLMNDPDNVYYV